ncbi:MAG: potassium-transporting ATPase subunit KdpB, partial [Burkholderiaceae bacterium]|nr:potassium-transporting ATPase subunit KdpB [Microbacteriaceae bacterium]
MSTTTTASPAASPTGTGTGTGTPSTAPAGAFSPRQLITALPGALRKLDPRQMWHNPVMLVVEVGAALTTVIAITELVTGPAPSGGAALPASFSWAIAGWLWITVVFANLAESVAEGRGKAQASSLRNSRTSTVAHLVTGYEASADPGVAATATTEVASADLTIGDVVTVTAGELIPGDGDIVWGIAAVDESAITGESAPVVRESGGDRSAVTGGTRVLSDRIVVAITSRPGETFVDRMIRLVEGASRQKTPNELALNILLASLSIVFLVVVLALNPMAGVAGATVSIPVLVALLVCLIPTTIGALLSAIGIAGMDRLVQRNVLALSGRAVEAAGDVTTLLLDKTGTITFGNRRATDVAPLVGTDPARLLRLAGLASLSDPTPEGSSIVDLAAEAGHRDQAPVGTTVVPFTAQTRMSGIDAPDGSQVRKGAGSAVIAWVEAQTPLTAGRRAELDAIVMQIAQSGGTPLVVAEQSAANQSVTNQSVANQGTAGVRSILGVVHLKDIVKPGLRERFADLRAMGIRTVMITGDNPLTAAAIAAEAGVDDFLAEATPEDKLALIRREQEGG